MSLIEKFYGSQQGKKFERLLNELRTELNILVDMTGADEFYMQDTLRDARNQIKRLQARVNSLQNTKAGLLSDLTKLKHRLRKLEAEKDGKNSDK